MIDSVDIEIIGYVNSCFTEKFGAPRQSGLVPSAEARLRMIEPFNRREMVRGLEGFSHIWLHFLFHRVKAEGWKTTVRPPRLGGIERIGVWATRSPHRPNFMGLSVVKLRDIDFSDGVELVIAGVDILDGTPVLDIKPYLPSSDSIEVATEGWAVQEFGALEVDFLPIAAQFCAKYEAETGVPLQQLISEILREDPRPASQRVKKDRYGMRLYNVNVHWHVSDAACQVLGCEKLV
ncbi:MAG: tRNA (N6-threonylcarbamoyladenosine(37)-N6)-methyltransferase TrmO [Desulfofustis sp.]|nr:tRNA (N6-threonylcarbamoyladenosine(37)-N6)-methyltransferase TrmO [Desulfofustis sp.]